MIPTRCSKRTATTQPSPQSEASGSSAAAGASPPTPPRPAPRSAPRASPSQDARRPHPRVLLTLPDGSHIIIPPDTSPDLGTSATAVAARLRATAAAPDERHIVFTAVCTADDPQALHNVNAAASALAAAEARWNVVLGSRRAVARAAAALGVADVAALELALAVARMQVSGWRGRGLG